MLSPWKKRTKQFLGALQTAQTPGWVLMQYTSPWETDSLNAEGNFKYQAHIFTLQSTQSETACLSLYTQACVRDKEPKSSDSLSTQYSSNSSFSMFIGRESLNSAILRVFFSQFMFLAESTLNMWYNSQQTKII